jgi:hypothetical protein
MPRSNLREWQRAFERSVGGRGRVGANTRPHPGQAREILERRQAGDFYREEELRPTDRTAVTAGTMMWRDWDEDRRAAFEALTSERLMQSILDLRRVMEREEVIRPRTFIASNAVVPPELMTATLRAGNVWLAGWHRKPRELTPEEKLARINLLDNPQETVPA